MEGVIQSRVKGKCKLSWNCHERRITLYPEGQAPHRPQEAPRGDAAHQGLGQRPHHRHLPGKAFIRELNRRLVGHYHYYAMRGNSHDLWRFDQTAVECAFKWLNRCGGKRKSFTWRAFNRALARLNIAKPRITETPPARQVFA